MEYQALYRKYRPNKFSDVVDQESILKILINSIKSNHISHAYLFSGPRGTGKTTIAKLIAKTVNCLNLNEDFSICGKCENCLDILSNSSDIIEIDAASNNGVDEIRELKSKINLVPSKLKYKVYIIDEVHMLSISAFNALLKTLEEPPSHVIFILATTEFYKVPETIVSRCQCLNFTRIKTSSIESRLKEVADLEKINITPEAIHEIALYSEGGMRDALGMLDKLASYSLETITANDFLTINGLISKNDIDKFIQDILEKNNINVINFLNEFDERGYDFSKLLEKIMQEVRDLMILNYTKKSKEIYDSRKLYDLILCLNDTYNLLKEAANRKIIVEVKLLNYMNNKKEEQNEIKKVDKKISQEISKIAENDVKTQKEMGNVQKEVKNNQNYSINLNIKRIRIDNTFAMASKSLKNIALNNWKKLDDYLVSNEYLEIAGLLKDCVVSVCSNAYMILTTKYESIIEKIYTNFDLVEDLITKIMENNYQIVLLTDEEFKIEVLDYKNHLNDKNYYCLKEEKESLITKENVVEKEDDLCYGNLVKKAIDVFGQDNIEIE